MNEFHNPPKLEFFDWYNVEGLDVLLCPEITTQDDLDALDEDALNSRCDGCVFNSPVYEKDATNERLPYHCQAAANTMHCWDNGDHAICAYHNAIWILPQQKEKYTAWLMAKRMHVKE